MYNGYWADAKSPETGLARKWDLGKPLVVEARYTLLPKQADRTLVRFTMQPKKGTVPLRREGPSPFSATGFSVALEDVLTNGAVFVRDFGVFVAPESSKRTLADYKRTINGRQTTLEKVRRMPDQTYAQAKKVLLDPRCNRDPMMLSLACGNSKF